MGSCWECDNLDSTLGIHLALNLLKDSFVYIIKYPKLLKRKINGNGLASFSPNVLLVSNDAVKVTNGSDRSANAINNKKLTTKHKQISLIIFHFLRVVAFESN